jgi:hypothetical protein
MDYLSNFMNKCISNQKSSIQDITESANQRLKEIQLELSKVEELRKEEKVLNSLLKQLGGDVKQSSCESIGSHIKFDELDVEIKNLSFSIIDFVQNNSNVSVRNIIDAVSSLENTRLVLSSLKWLIDNKILSRDESTRLISRGELWEEKEKSLNLINLKN